MQFVQMPKACCNLSSVEEWNGKGMGIKTETKTNKISINTMFIIILILVILALEAVGGAIVYSAYVKEKNCSIKTEGVLLEWGKRIKKNKRKYYPIVQYWVGDEAYKEISSVETEKLPFKEGAPLTIYYNPSNPFEFYTEGYDLILIRSFGRVFMIMGAALALVNLICTILNRVDMDEKRRVHIKEIEYALGVLFVFYWMMITLSGIGPAVLATIIIAPFVIYVKYKNRPKDQDDSALK